MAFQDNHLVRHTPNLLRIRLARMCMRFQCKPCLSTCHCRCNHFRHHNELYLQKKHIQSHGHSCHRCRGCCRCKLWDLQHKIHFYSCHFRCRRFHRHSCRYVRHVYTPHHLHKYPVYRGRRRPCTQLAVRCILLQRRFHLWCRRCHHHKAFGLPWALRRILHPYRQFPRMDQVPPHLRSHQAADTEVVHPHHLFRYRRHLVVHRHHLCRDRRCRHQAGHPDLVYPKGRYHQPNLARQHRHKCQACRH